MSPAQLAAYTAVFTQTICDDCVVDTHYRVGRNKQPGASHFTRATLARVLTMQAPPISICGGDLQLHVCILSKRTDRSNWFWQYYWHYYHYRKRLTGYPVVLFLLLLVITVCVFSLLINRQRFHIDPGSLQNVVLSSWAVVGAL